ncbi:hypothetical protein GCK32_000863 [Trichostrongylus colubriformis]|uniref:Uncharacterized protein n=1 Tax=Trichostrongylus colubriformis TaxID=6319 RepID=A0AAN8IEE8_TRICO
MWCLGLIILAVAISAEEEHFLDVKQIVKGTIEAVANLPMPQQNNSNTTQEKEPEDFYRIFQLPADIMKKIAEDAGYLDTTPHTTTSGPWIVRRKVPSSEEEDDDQEGYEEEEEEKRKKKKKHSKKDPTLISIRDILSKVDQVASTTPVTIPLPPIPIPSADPPPTIAALPVVESDTGLTHSNVRPQYAYQPILQPDGKTYYQQVLIVPGQVMSGGVVSSLNNPSSQKTSFIQERPLLPKSIVQADYSVTAPTFPPQVEVFQRNEVASSQPSQRSSVYPARFVKSPSKTDTARIPQSDPIAISSARPSTYEPRSTTPKESLYTTKLPSSDEQKRQARVFHEEAVVPPRQVVKTVQESPLRIQTVDSHVQQANDDETNAIRHLKRDEELKRALERHGLELDPQTSSSRKRKLRKSKKIKKYSKKAKWVDVEDDTPSDKPTVDEFRTIIRRMPETRYLHRVPSMSPVSMRKRERMHASKTWKSAKYEPSDESVPKDAESVDEEKEDDEEVTEPPRKRRRMRKTSKSRKIRMRMEEEGKQENTSRSREDFDDKAVSKLSKIFSLFSLDWESISGNLDRQDL